MKKGRARKAAGEGVSRRDFLKVGGAGVAAAALGSLPFLSARAVREREVESWDREADVLVLGYGGAGAAAAIAAYDAGADVLVLEKREVGGGTTITSGGTIQGGATSVQEREGIEDSSDAYYEYLIATGGGMNDPDLVRVLADQSAESIEWLIELGGEFPTAPTEGGPERELGREPVARAHSIRYGDYDDGVAFFRVLSDAVDERDVDVVYEAAARRLVIDEDGAVVGVLVEIDGQEEHVRARRGVVLATGGFAHNEEMLATYTRQGHYAEPLTPPGTTGDGQRMAFAVGAGAASMTALIRTAGFTPPGMDRGLAGTTVGIMVNLRGERYVDEYAFYDWAADRLAAQSEGRAFAVFDERIREEHAPIAATLSHSLDEEVSNGLVLRADSLAELAEAMGVPSDRLERTVERWNEHAANEDDPDFGRTQGFQTIEEAPFYAFEQVVTLYDTAGGARIGPDARVLGVFGDPIPRLYAAGTVAGGAIGQYYIGSGGGLNVAITFGRIAGRNAANEEA
jgi:flavocytochrome c